MSAISLIISVIVRSSTEAAQYHINTAAYPSTVNSSGQKLSFLMYYYNITLGHHKVIDAPTDRNIHVFTSAVSTDLCMQLLNIVLSVHREHLPLPTWTHHIMPKVDRIRVGFLWVWTDPLSCPSISSVCLISYTDIRSLHLHCLSLSPPPNCFSTQCSIAQRLLKSIQPLSVLRLKQPQGPSITQRHASSREDLEQPSPSCLCSHSF